MGIFNTMNLNIPEPKVQYLYVDQDRNSAGILLKSVLPELTNIVGNSVRVALIGLTPGIKPTMVSLSGAVHELKSVPNINENMRMIISSVSKTLIKFTEGFDLNVLHDTSRPIELYYKGKVKGDLKFGEFKSKLSNIDIINKDLKILSTSEEVDVDMVIIYEVGVGFREANKHTSKLGFISIDTNFSPIKTAMYKVEEIGEAEEGTKDLIIEVETNGTIDAQDAFNNVFRLLGSYFSVLRAPNMDNTNVSYKLYEGNKTMNKDHVIESKAVEELNLSTSEYNKVKDLGIANVRDFINRREEIPEELVNKVIDELEAIGFKVFKN